MSSSQAPLIPPRPTGTPAGSGRSTPNLPSDLSGVELLQLSQHVRFAQRHREEEKAAEEEVELASGDALSVQLVTVDVSQAYGHPQIGGSHQETDIFLVLSIPSSDFTLPLLAWQRVLPDRRGNAYVFESPDVPGASIVLYLDASTAENSNTDSSAKSIAAFEDILASYCAFEDDHSPEDRGKIELISAEDGSVLGAVEMPNGMVLQEDPALGGRPALRSSSSSSSLDKEPVLIDLDFEDFGAGKGKDGQQVISVVRPISRYEEPKPTELPSQTGQADAVNEKSDWMLRSADYISRGIMNGGAALGKKMQAGADAYVARSSGGSKGAGSASSSGRSTPTRIGPKTLERAATVSEYSGRVVQVSNKTAQSIMTVAGRFGDRIGKATGIQRPASDPNKIPTGFRGVLNRSLVAASSVWDSVDQSAQRVLEDGGSAASKVIRTKYGDEAAMLSKSVGQTGKSVFLIYKDVSGVRRKALLKVAGGGVIKARTKDGQEVQVQLAQSQSLQHQKQGNSVIGAVEPSSSVEKS